MKGKRDRGNKGTERESRLNLINVAVAGRKRNWGETIFRIVGVKESEKRNRENDSSGGCREKGFFTDTGRCCGGRFLVLCLLIFFIYPSPFSFLPLL
jgi:hypothetical protein